MAIESWRCSKCGYWWVGFHNPVGSRCPKCGADAWVLAKRDSKGNSQLSGSGDDVQLADVCPKCGGKEAHWSGGQLVCSKCGALIPKANRNLSANKEGYVPGAANKPGAGHVRRSSVLAETCMAQLANVPVTALNFSDHGEAVFDTPAGEGKAKTITFRPALSGKPINDQFWGTLGINLSGISFKASVPIVGSDEYGAHKPGTHLGVIRGEQIAISNEAGLVVEKAQSLSNADSQRLFEDAAQGFPFEASVRLQPTKILFVRDGEKATVNGYEFAGPGVIFDKSKLRHIAVVEHGADDETLTVAASQPQSGLNLTGAADLGVSDMDLSKMTVEELAAARPDLVQSLKDAGKGEAMAGATEEQKARIAELSAMLGGTPDAELAAKVGIVEGKTFVETAAGFIKSLREKHAAELAAKDAELANAKKGTSAAPFAPAGGGENHAQGEPTDWAGALAAVRSAHADLSEAKVAAMAATKYPKLYEAARSIKE